MSEADQLEEVRLDTILINYRPGSHPPPWDWDDEERDLFHRTCCCCSHLCDSPSIGPEGHYQRQLEEHIVERGVPGYVLLGDDGRVWDGHHRVVAARRLGIDAIHVMYAGGGDG